MEIFIELITADLAIDRTAQEGGSQVFRWAAERVIQVAGNRKNRIAKLFGVHATLVLARRAEAGIERRTLTLESFFLDYRRQDRRPGEFVEAVLVPKLAPGMLFHASKVSKRFDEDISAVCGAFRLTLDADGRIGEARLAYGGMAGIPKRATVAEAALLGLHWDEEAAAAAIAALPQDFMPLSDMRASAAYRLKIAGNLLRRFLIETREPETRTRVAGLLAEAAHG